MLHSQFESQNETLFNFFPTWVGLRSAVLIQWNYCSQTLITRESRPGLTVVSSHIKHTILEQIAHVSVKSSTPELWPIFWPDHEFNGRSRELLCSSCRVIQMIFNAKLDYARWTRSSCFQRQSERKETWERENRDFNHCNHTELRLAQSMPWRIAALE